jgi:hypothetical protein
MGRKKIRNQYKGTDDKIYRGKAIKARKRLEARQKNWEAVTSKIRGSIDGWRRPGSMTK